MSDLVADSTRRAHAAAGAFELPRIVGLRLIGDGNNTTFEVRTTDRSRFVLRIHRPAYRTLDHINSELRFLRYLGDCGVRVPQPMLTRNGRLAIETDGRYCDLLTWVPGDVVSADSGLDAATVHELGRAAGLIHNASARFEPPTDFALPRWDADGMFTAAASPYRPLLDLDEILSTVDRKLFDDIAERTRAIFDAIAGHHSYGIIHGDYILGNCHLNKFGNSWRAGVFDFDDCGWGYYLYDLCPLLGNLAGYPGPIANNPAYPALR